MYVGAMHKEQLRTVATLEMSFKHRHMQRSKLSARPPQLVRDVDAWLLRISLDHGAHASIKKLTEMSF